MVIKMKKKLLSVLLVFLLVIGTSFIVFASNTTDNNNSTERQYERLHELSEMLQSGIDIPIASHRGYGAYITMPQLSLIASPPCEDGNFLIGVSLDADVLELDDWDAIVAHTRTEVPNEIVEFILDFTGIPSENVNIGYSFSERIGVLYVGDFVPSEICPVWGDDRSVELYHGDQISPRASMMRMGHLVVTDNMWLSTVGHPISGNTSASFISALHLGIPSWPQWPQMPHMLIHSRTHNNALIGTLESSTFNSSVDIAIMRISVPMFQMSSEIPTFPGGFISNFRGVPRANDRVVSIRGISGPNHDAIITNPSATVPGAPWPGIVNMMLVYPLGMATQGDSGAALIRTSDRAVMGTFSGRTVHNGVVFGFYTNVQNYM